MPLYDIVEDFPARAEFKDTAFRFAIEESEFVNTPDITPVSVIVTGSSVEGMSSVPSPFGSNIRT